MAYLSHTSTTYLALEAFTSVPTLQCISSDIRAKEFSAIGGSYQAAKVPSRRDVTNVWKK